MTYVFPYGTNLSIAPTAPVTVSEKYLDNTKCMCSIVVPFE
jgi:hypothetical protein